MLHSSQCSNKYLFHVLVFDRVGSVLIGLAQNCSIPFHDTFGTDGNASPLRLPTCRVRMCRQLLGEECSLFGDVNSTLRTVI